MVLSLLFLTLRDHENHVLPLLRLGSGGCLRSLRAVTIRLLRHGGQRRVLARRTAYLVGDIPSGFCHEVRYVDEDNGDEDEIKGAGMAPGQDDKDALSVAGEPKVVLDYESLQRTCPDESEQARGP